jgi:hypothetical protein
MKAAGAPSSRFRIIAASALIEELTRARGTCRAASEIIARLALSCM